MTRTLLASLCVGLALVSVGCVEPRHYRDYDHGARRDRDYRVDLNHASQHQLERLPGISEADADRIIANRPYRDAEALVRRGILGPRKFEGIEDYVYAGGDRSDRRWTEDDRRYRDDRRYDDHYDRDRYDDRY